MNTVNSEARPFRVLIVAEDRKMLRRLSRFLRMFGYDVQQVANTAQAMRITAGNKPDILILDSAVVDKRTIQDLREFVGPESYSFVFLIVDQITDAGLTEALEAGVDDFLAKPIVYGELLTRLRASARTLEYERRIQQQSTVDRSTALLTRTAFLEKLESFAAASSVNSPTSCVMVDVDLLNHVNHHFGYAAGDLVIRSVGDHVGKLCGDTGYPAYLDNGCFAIMMPDQTDAQAFAWAENLRAAVAEIEIPYHDQVLSVTVSAGVAGHDDATSTNTMLERAQAALEDAKNSGRDCVARCGQFEGETKEWEDMAAQGKLFETTVARDIMTPLALVLPADECLQSAAAMLQQTGLTDVPVVNQNGRLAGLVSTDTVATLPGEAQRRLRDVMAPKPPQFDEKASFCELMEHFTDNDDSQIVVVRDGYPVGLVHRGVLAALSEPVTTASFAPHQSYSSGSDYLLVAEPASSE